MSKAPFMPLWVSDFLADTIDLSGEERAFCLMLLVRTWHNKARPFPDEPAVMCRVLGVHPNKWPRLRDALMPFFDLSGGSWRSRRLEEEWGKIRRKSEVQRENVNKRWHANPLNPNGGGDTTVPSRNGGGNTLHIHTHTHNQKDPPSHPPTDPPTGRQSGGMRRIGSFECEWPWTEGEPVPEELRLFAEKHRPDIDPQAVFDRIGWTCRRSGARKHMWVRYVQTCFLNEGQLRQRPNLTVVEAPREPPRDEAAEPDGPDPWRDFCRMLAAEDSVQYRCWFRDVRCLGVDGRDVVVEVPRPAVAEHLRQRYEDRIRRAFLATDPTVRGVAVRVAPRAA